MTDLTREGLVELAERVEQASGPDRELDCRTWAAIQGGPSYDVCVAVVPNLHEWTAPPYTASLDASRSIWAKWDHAEVYRPDHETLGWTVHLFENANLSRYHHTGVAATEELAWLAAALRARAMEAGRG